MKPKGDAQDETATAPVFGTACEKPRPDMGQFQLVQLFNTPDSFSAVLVAQCQAVIKTVLKSNFAGDRLS